MTDAASDQVKAKLARRYAAERRFRWYGIGAISLAVLFLGVLLTSIAARGITAFLQTEVKLDIHFSEQIIDPAGTRDVEEIGLANYNALIRKSLEGFFPDVKNRRERRALNGLVSSGAQFELREMVLENPALIGETRSIWLLASDDVDMVMKGAIDRNAPENERRIDDKALGWISQFDDAGRLALNFNTRFFTQGDSREPEMAGVLGAVMGSIFSLLVCFVLSFPLGVLTAVYLEEFAPRNRWTEIIEVNINNLAAVPSIVFGLLGLAVFLNFFGLPRSAPLVGGMVLAIMTLPTVIIAAQAAIKMVPPSIREAALALGASPIQTVFQHVVPLALPGMLTGTIIGMARALGETAPLLMIGMVAFVVDVPTGILDPATALPVQIFLWADSPERAFVERTSAAILVLLGFLLIMNMVAIVMRKKYEIRW